MNNIRPELIKIVEQKIFSLDTDMYKSLNQSERKFFLSAQKKHKEQFEEQRKQEREEKKKLRELEGKKVKKRGCENPIEYVPFKDNKATDFEGMIQEFIRESKDKNRKIKTEFSSNRESRILKQANNKRREITLMKRN